MAAYTHPSFERDASVDGSRDKVMERRLLMNLKAPCSPSDWHFVTPLAGGTHHFLLKTPPLLREVAKAGAVPLDSEVEAAC